MTRWRNAHRSEALTLRELVAAGGLGLEVVAGHAGIDRAIEAVYIGDLEDPTPWMVEGSLLLTTGPRFEEDPASAARLVELLKQSGMVGVGVAIMPYVREIPAEMVAAADREQLPLLRVPGGHAVPRDHQLRLQRAVLARHASPAPQRGAAEAAAGGAARRAGPERAGPARRRAAGRLDAPVRRVGTAGRELHDGHRAERGTRSRATPGTPTGRSSLSGTPRSVLDVQGRHVAFREARADGAVEQVLMAAYPEGSLISEFADEALTFAQRLLEVEATTGRNVSLLRRRTRAGLLDMLMHGRGATSELGERLNYHGIEPTEQWRMLAFSVGAPGGSRRDHPSVADAMADALLGTIDRLLEEDGVPFLSRQSRGQVLVLAPLAELRRSPPPSYGSSPTSPRTPVPGCGPSASTSASRPPCRGSTWSLERPARLASRCVTPTWPGSGTAQVVAFDDLGRRYKVLDSLARRPVAGARRRGRRPADRRRPSRPQRSAADAGDVPRLRRIRRGGSRRVVRAPQHAAQASRAHRGDPRRRPGHGRRPGGGVPWGARETYCPRAGAEMSSLPRHAVSA